METKKLSVNTICVRGGYTPKNGEPDEDTFQEDDYDHFEDDPEFDPEAEY